MDLHSRCHSIGPFAKWRFLVNLATNTRIREFASLTSIFLFYDADSANQFIIYKRFTRSDTKIVQGPNPSRNRELPSRLGKPPPIHEFANSRARIPCLGDDLGLAGNIDGAASDPHTASRMGLFDEKLTRLTGEHHGRPAVRSGGAGHARRRQCAAGAGESAMRNAPQRKLIDTCCD